LVALEDLFAASIIPTIDNIQNNILSINKEVMTGVKTGVKTANFRVTAFLV